MRDRGRSEHCGRLRGHSGRGPLGMRGSHGSVLREAAFLCCGLRQSRRHRQPSAVCGIFPKRCTLPGVSLRERFSAATCKKQGRIKPVLPPGMAPGSIQALPLCRKKPKKAREPGAKGDNPRFALLASRHGSRRQPSTAALPEKTEKSKGTRSKTVRIASKMPEFRPALLRGEHPVFQTAPFAVRKPENEKQAKPSGIVPEPGGMPDVTIPR